MDCNETAAKMRKRHKIYFVDTLRRVRGADSRTHVTTDFTDFTDFTDWEFVSGPAGSIRAISEIRGSSVPLLRLAGLGLCVELLSEIGRCQSIKYL